MEKPGESTHVHDLPRDANNSEYFGAWDVENIYLVDWMSRTSTHQKPSKQKLDSLQVLIIA